MTHPHSSEQRFRDNDFRGLFRGRHFRGRGFVLVLTLVLIVIAAVMLAAVARRSMATALDARSNLDDLQRRWGALTLTVAILPRAERILQDAEKESHAPVAHLTARCQLGDMEFELTLCDEQAKANVNRLLATRSRRSVYDSIRTLSADSESSLPLEVRSLVVFDGSDHAKRTIQSFGQIFENPSPLSIQTGAARLTCWGDGRLNWRRTPPEVFREILTPFVDHAVIQQLIDMRGSGGAEDMADIDQAVAQLEGVTRSGREALVRMLTRASRCHSLWITTTNEHRRWDRLAVAETPDPDLPGARGSNWEFEW